MKNRATDRWLPACAAMGLLIVSAAADQNPEFQRGPAKQWEADAGTVAIEALERMRRTKIPRISLVGKTSFETFEIVRKELEREGFRVDLKKGVDATQPLELHLKDVPVATLVDYFAAFSRWYWTVAKDGTVTFYPSTCACGHVDGFEAHPE